MFDYQMLILSYPIRFSNLFKSTNLSPLIKIVLISNNNYFQLNDCNYETNKVLSHLLPDSNRIKR